MGKKLMKVAGILNIVCGAIFVLYSVFYLLQLINPSFFKVALHRNASLPKMISTGVLLAIPAVLGISSGLYALRGKKWWFAFAVSLFLSLIPVLSTAASILLVIARHDWSLIIRILISSVLALWACFVILIYIAVAF